MIQTSTKRTAIVIPNWNGKDEISQCLDSLKQAEFRAEIVIVENGSTDGSLEFLRENYPSAIILPQDKNLGFAGGVNVGIQYALDNHFEYVTLLNNDAVVGKLWLTHLENALDNNPDVGIATSKIMDIKKEKLDSTGDIYTVWGLPYPRGRGEKVSKKYDELVNIFGASGGASIYRCSVLKQIGLFDEKFFAYYEDVDVSFRAQLAGWKIQFAPKAIVYHQISATGGRIKGFTTYQAMKNQPMLLWKNVPRRHLLTVLPRFSLAYTLMLLKAVATGRGWYALKGFLVFIKNIPYTFSQRHKIQSTKTVSDDYIWSIITHDLPPNAHNLRTIRQKWWKLKGKST